MSLHSSGAFLLLSPAKGFIFHNCPPIKAGLGEANQVNFLILGINFALLGETKSQSGLFVSSKKGFC